MKSLARSFVVSVTLSLSAVATAYAQITVSDAWVRATVAQQHATGAFMQIKADQDSKLVGVSTPLTPVAEVHEMKMEGDVMKMRPVPAVDLPAGKLVELKPSGYHVMLMDLKQQVKAGESVPITLVIEDKDGKRENVDVTAVVRPLNAGEHSMEISGHKH